eukprot:scaffold52377_cov48-Cyclotella_meneghiniana.AAC.1
MVEVPGGSAVGGRSSRGRRTTPFFLEGRLEKAERRAIRKKTGDHGWRDSRHYPIHISWSDVALLIHFYGGCSCIIMKNSSLGLCAIQKPKLISRPSATTGIIAARIDYEQQKH